MSLIDDLAGLFGAAPAGPALPVHFRQGLVIAWDPVTRANTVRIGGTEMTNVAILNTSEADLLVAGDAVAVLAVGPRETGGAATWAIIGRVVTLNSAVSSMAALMTATATITAAEATATGTYTDLTTEGPTVEATIGPTGRALVTVGTNLTGTGLMSFAISGGLNFADGDDARAVGATATRTTLLTALTPGVSTFTAKYRSTAGSPTWSNRNITVLSL